MLEKMLPTLEHIFPRMYIPMGGPGETLSGFGWIVDANLQRDVEEKTSVVTWGRTRAAFFWRSNLVEVLHPSLHGSQTYY